MFLKNGKIHHTFLDSDQAFITANEEHGDKKIRKFVQRFILKVPVINMNVNIMETRMPIIINFQA